VTLDFEHHGVLSTKLIQLTNSHAADQHCLGHAVRQVADLVSLAIDAPASLDVARKRPSVANAVARGITAVTPATPALTDFNAELRVADGIAGRVGRRC